MRQAVIAAVSTPPGKGGVAIIRISGEGALALADMVFSPKNKKSLSEMPPRMQVYGYVYSRSGEVIDDGLGTYFPEGSSYTGEETVELSVHGGTLVTRAVLERVFEAGAMPAEAGEFTRRAFLNGKLSLTEVEAIGTLLEARTEEQLRLSSTSARGRLRDRISELRGELLTILSSIYARIDYPEEDLGDFTDEETVERLTSTRGSLSRLIQTYRTGRAISEGISCVLAGKPNVGKSTVYNLLCGDDAAIVTDTPGTTRDILEREVPLGRVLLHLHDTAGVRDAEDGIEKIGIMRTKERIAEAELVIALFDLSREYDSEDDELISLLKEARGAKIALLTKSDIAKASFDKSRLDGVFDTVLTVSAESDPEGLILALGDTVNSLFTDEKISTRSDAIVASARQHSALTSALGFIDAAIDALMRGVPQDAASSDIELALGAIGEVDGRAVSDDVVGEIFSHFCVGK